MRFLMTTLTLMEIYAIVAMALNLLLGVAGRFSAYEAALMGIGAYTASLLALTSKAMRVAMPRTSSRAPR